MIEVALEKNVVSKCLIDLKSLGIGIDFSA